MKEFLIGFIGVVAGIVFAVLYINTPTQRTGEFSTPVLNSSQLFTYVAPNLGLGTSTPNKTLVINNEPPGTGAAATTTLTLGDTSTTTARSSVQWVNTAGNPECQYMVGTTPTVTPGLCN